MWTKLMYVDGVHAGLSFQGGMHRPVYSADDVKAIAPLLPHLSQAMLLRWRFQKLSQMARLGQQVLDHLDSPVLVINAKAHILFANIAAQDWLKQGNHPFAHQATLHQATPWPQLLNMARQICSTEPVPVATLKLDAVEGRKQAYLVGLPLQQAHPIAQGWSQPVGLVVVHDPTRHQAPWPQLLRQLFGLTVAESRLVEQLAQHHSLIDAAAMLNIGSETGRSQLKSVFRKTGMRNQSALLQLITKLLQMR